MGAREGGERDWEKDRENEGGGREWGSRREQARRGQRPGADQSRSCLRAGAEQVWSRRGAGAEVPQSRRGEQARSVIFRPQTPKFDDSFTFWSPRGESSATVSHSGAF